MHRSLGTSPGCGEETICFVSTFECHVRRGLSPKRRHRKRLSIE